MAFVKAAHVKDVKPGEGKVVSLNGQEIALFSVDGKIHAIQNNCPHRGGPLGEGMLDDAVVTCPWHGWRFNVVTGKSSSMPMAIKTYHVKVENDDVLVDL